MLTWIVAEVKYQRLCAAHLPCSMTEYPLYYLLYYLLYCLIYY